jgi:uncharacterized protein YneR
MTSTGYSTKVAYRLLKSNRVIKQICDELNSLKTDKDLKWFEDDIVVTKVHISGEKEESKVRVSIEPTNDESDIYIEYTEYLYRNLSSATIYFSNHQIKLDFQNINLYKTIMNSMYAGG